MGPAETPSCKRSEVKASPAPSTQDVAAVEDHNDSACAVCSDGGVLICCESCPQAYHVSCLEEGVPEDDDDAGWTCAMGGRECCRRRAAIGIEEHEWASSFAWGPALPREGKDRYASFTLRGEKYKVGDTATLSGPEGEVFVGRIDALFEDAYGTKWGIFQWYYRPEETIYGRLGHHLENEVFMSALLDESPLESVTGKCVVRGVTPQDEAARNERGSVRKKRRRAVGKKKRRAGGTTLEFLCRQRYDMETGEYRPIIAHAEQKVDILRPLRGAQEMIDDGMDDFAKAAAVLQLSAVPPELPCRSSERDEIRDFVETSIRQGRSDKGLYISGMPGTGKTATVMQVMRAAKAKSAQGTLPRFRFVALNAMKLPDPSQLYRELWAQLTREQASPKRAALLLQRRFSTPSSSRSCCVLLVDEIDYIMNQKQDVMYNLFNWPSLRHAKLVVIGIANTMDLPERLMPRVHSRMGLRRMTFSAYTRQQIERIIKSRLQGLTETFEDDAVELCARKVASTTGDVRKALQICRRAGEICSASGTNDDAESGRTGRVSMRHISQAIRELFRSPYIELMPHLTRAQKVFINALMLEAKRLQKQQVEYDLIVDRYQRISTLRGYQPLRDPSDLLLLRDELASTRVVDVARGKIPRNPLVQLIVHPDDVHYALREDMVWSKLNHG